MTTSTSARPSAAASRGRLPAPVRDRRPALAALAVLLVIAGALTSALVAYRSGDRVDVLVAARDISVGDVINAGDFRVARVASDGANFVSAAAIANFTGTRATGDIPDGTLVNNRMFQTGSLLPDDAAVVGLVLSATQRPAGEMRSGDVVQVYAVPRDAGPGAPALLIADAVKVTEIGAVDSGDALRLSLLVPAADAADFVAATTGGLVTVARLAPGTEPVIDFLSDEG